MLAYFSGVSTSGSEASKNDESSAVASDIGHILQFVFAGFRFPNLQPIALY